MLTNELNIIMVAPRMIGKTSILAAMHEEFDKTWLLLDRLVKPVC